MKFWYTNIRNMPVNHFYIQLLKLKTRWKDSLQKWIKPGLDKEMLILYKDLLGIHMHFAVFYIYFLSDN